MSNKNILAIETSTQACSVALQAQQKVFSHHKILPRQHNRVILQHIQQLLQQASVTLAEVDALAYGQGPGSFTGIRLAAAVTQGLALAQNYKLVGLSSLKILALSAYKQYQVPEILVCIDAKMNEVYFAHYRIQQKNIALIGEEQCVGYDALQIDDQLNYLAVGDGWFTAQAKMLLKKFPTLKLVAEPTYPNAIDMLDLAEQAMANKQTLEIQAVQPNYLRQMHYQNKST
ncbi:MAG: tRNA (adenosine(37)-N6)-threonylcarbamoyltransferase complex dimerization subunit type 1 TsaB [Pseudomonadota bacterium]